MDKEQLEGTAGVTGTDGNTPIAAPTAKLTLKEAQAKVTSAEKLEDVKEAVGHLLIIADAIAAESERLVAEQALEKNRLAEVEKAKNEATAANEALKLEVANVSKMLAEIQSLQASAQAEARFNQRMDALDATFELGDSEKALLVEDVKSLDDEAFAKWMEKNTILMKEKTKAHIAEVAAKKAPPFTKKDGDKKDGDKEPDPKDPNEDSEDETAEGKKKAKEAKASIDAALDVAKASVGDPLLAAPSVEGGKDLREELKEAFRKGISIGGKNIKEIKAKDSK